MGIKVKATRLCYYGHQRRRVGEVFEIESEKDFSPTYMESLDPKFKSKKPVKAIHSRESRDLAHNVAQKAAAKPAPKVKEADPEVPESSDSEVVTPI